MRQLRLGTLTLLSLTTIERTLHQIPGLGSKTIKIWIRSCGLTSRTLTQNITPNQWQRLVRLYERHSISPMKVNIQQAILKKTYKGWRHNLNLPVRGQKTHRNAQTQRKLSPLRRTYHDWKIPSNSLKTLQKTSSV